MTGWKQIREHVVLLYLFHSASVAEHGQCKFGNGNSLYQAEPIAIINSLEYIFSVPIHECFSQINIFSDSISLLLSIKDIYQRLTREIQYFVKFFTAFTSVNFYWRKVHSNILGNEMADYFAKDSTLNPISVKSKSKSTWLDRWRTPIIVELPISSF